MSTPGTPILPGYTVTWDVTTGEWVARSDTFGTVLHGQDQAELDAARWRHVCSLADELSAILRTSTWHGYPLPEPSPDPSP